jgi:hypothetical protein
MASRFYIYRFKNNDDEIIYVGKTGNIKYRMNQHFTAGHLPKECYDAVKEIEFVKLSSNTEMDIYETYFINKYNPKYNTVNTYNEKCLLELPEVYWQLFSSNNKDRYLDIERKYVELLNKNKQIENENKLLKSHIENISKIKNDSKVLYHNQNSIMFDWDDIVYVYTKLKSNKLTFNTTISYGNKIIYGKYKIYYDDDEKINLVSYYTCGEKSNDIVQKFNLEKSNKIKGFYYGMCVKYLPSHNVAYTVLKSRYQGECEKLKKEYEIEYFASDIINNLHSNTLFNPRLTDITNENDDRLNVSNNDNKITIYYSAKAFDKYEELTESEFINKFSSSVFKHDNCKSLKCIYNELQEKINQIDILMNYNSKIS